MARPLRFCQITTFYPPYSFGGDAVYVYRLANALAARGHQVDVIHCLDSYRLLAPGKTLPPPPNHSNVRVHALHSRLGPLSPLLTQQTGRPWLKTSKILRILRSGKFDVIHFHNVSLFGPKVLEIDPGYEDVIKLYTTHEYWLVCPMHVLWKNGDRLCDHPPCLRCILKSHRPPQLWRCTNSLEKAARHIDQFIAPSRFAVEIQRKRGFDKPFVLLPHFSPRPDNAATCADNPRRHPYFLFAGRLEKIKGLQEVIPAFRSYPQADLLVAGTGAYEPEIHRLAQGMKNLVFLGWLSAQQLRDLYRNAIALIVPSLCYEISPMVILEGFAHGLPAIANDLGALAEMIQETQGGITYTGPKELLEAMDKLQTNSELRSRLGDNARRAWEQRYTEEIHLSAYFDILAETARRKFGRVPWAAETAWLR
jgi:glycosyltransferase involved in cell wall biosynthesis